MTIIQDQASGALQLELGFYVLYFRSLKATKLIPWGK